MKPLTGTHPLALSHQPPTMPLRPCAQATSGPLSYSYPGVVLLQPTTTPIFPHTHTYSVDHDLPSCVNRHCRRSVSDTPLAKHNRLVSARKHPCHNSQQPRLGLTTSHHSPFTIPTPPASLHCPHNGPHCRPTHDHTAWQPYLNHPGRSISQ
jgi:hypothetical protein